MFDALIQMANNIINMNGSQLLSEVMNEPSLQAQIIDLNQEQLYEKGIDSKGAPTGQYAHATIYGTVNFPGKISKGLRIDHITLKDSGASYNTMKVRSDNGETVIDAQFPEAVERGWPDAMGLTDQSIDEIIPEVADRLSEKIINKALS